MKIYNINGRKYSSQQHATCKKWRTIHDETDVPDNWPQDNQQHPFREFVGILYTAGGEWYARTNEAIELDPHHYQSAAMAALIQYYSMQRSANDEQ